MFRKAIIATDLSAAAFAVVKNMVRLKGLGIEECLLLHCLELPESEPHALTATALLDQNLRDQKKLLEDLGFRTETRIVPGFAAHEVNRIAAEESYSLIVVGAETRTILSEPLVGGIAYEIIHECRFPTLLVRLDEARREGILYVEPARSDYQAHILFPTDFSETADRTFEVILELAAASAFRKITLMHVQDQTRLDPYLLHKLSQFNEIDAERLGDMEKALRGANAGIEVDKVITYGNPSRDILREVRDREIQMVVMGSQGRGFVRDLFIGSVGHNLARQSEASVLLIPARRE